MKQQLAVRAMPENCVNTSRDENNEVDAKVPFSTGMKSKKNSLAASLVQSIEYEDGQNVFYSGKHAIVSNKFIYSL